MLHGTVDAQNLAYALDNLTECAAMLMNLAARAVEREAASLHAGDAAGQAALVEALRFAREALVELRDRCAKVKTKLNAGIPEGEPVHGCASDLTWPMSTAGLAIGKIDATLSTHGSAQTGKFTSAARSATPGEGA
jgi:hypothetical protein